MVWLTEYILYIGQYSLVQLSKRNIHVHSDNARSFDRYKSIYAELKQALKLGDSISHFQKPKLRDVAKTADHHKIAQIMAKEHWVHLRAVS